MAASLPLPMGRASCCQEVELPGTPGLAYQRRRGPGSAKAGMGRDSKLQIPNTRKKHGNDEIRMTKSEINPKRDLKAKAQRSKGAKGLRTRGGRTTESFCGNIL